MSITDYALEKKSDLTALANAIRTKTGTNESLTLSQMKDSVDNLEIGGGGGDDELLKGILEDTLSSVVIPTGTTKLKHYIFYNSANLTNITIPDTVTSIGNYAFAGCTNLTKIPTANGITNYSEYMFYKCTGLTNLNIPENITNISSRAFSLCSGLSSVEIPSQVINIGDYAFSECQLSDLTLREGLQTIGTYAFYKNAIAEIIIPDSVTSIDTGAFSTNTEVQQIEIGGGAKTIGNNAFHTCKKVNTVVLNCDYITLKATSSGTNNVFSYLGQETDGVTVIIGDKMQYISSYLFCPSTANESYAPNITSIQFGENSICESIYSYAFEYFKGETITFPPSLKRLEFGVFGNSTTLKTVYFKGQPNSIASNAFSASVTDIYVPWSKNRVANAPWGAKNATIHYDSEV